MENRSVRREERESASYACRERSTSPRNRDAKRKTLVKDTVCESSLTETELRWIGGIGNWCNEATSLPLWCARGIFRLRAGLNPSVCDHGGRGAVRRESSALGVYDISWRNNGALVPATYRSRLELCIQRLLSTPERALMARCARTVLKISSTASERRHPSAGMYRPNGTDGTNATVTFVTFVSNGVLICKGGERCGRQ